MMIIVRPEIVQFDPAIPMAGLKRESPTKLITGAIASGEIRLSSIYIL